MWRGGLPGCLLSWELIYKGQYGSGDSNCVAEYFKKDSAFSDSIFMSCVVFCYRDGVRVELDFKQAFNFFKDAVKASNTNATSVFLEC